MTGLATYLKLQGFDVSGSDERNGEKICFLRENGIEVFVGKQDNICRIDNADVVVYTDAIPFENKELAYARETKKQVYSRGELLRQIAGRFSTVLAVGGSHGKTTCTSMCAHVFKEAGASFCAHIGGEDAEIGSFYYSGDEYFLTEACEYKQNLLKIPADVAILLNADKDHLDCSRDENQLFDTFAQFCSTAKIAVVSLDDKVASVVNDAVTFSVYEKGADYRAVNLRQEGERYAFSVVEYGVRLCRIRLGVVGRCHVYNALAAFAAMRALGFSVDEIKRGLENFQSVKRRFERVGKYRGADVICDYAHHPREILTTVQTAKGLTRGKLLVVFQPHTYSRTETLMGEFVEVFKPIEQLKIYKTFAAREAYKQECDAKTLAEKIGDCLYSDGLSSLRAWWDRTASDGDCILFLGAGDIYYLAQYLAKEIV